MNFLLNGINEDTLLLIALAICAIIAVGYYILRPKAPFNTQDSDSNSNIDSSSDAETNVDSDENEVIAAITAAITMAEAESNGLKFRVVSFRRK